MTPNPWNQIPLTDMGADFAELDGYGTEYQPRHSGFAPGLEVLSDGFHDFEITAAVLDRAKDGSLIAKLNLREPNAGEIEWTHWLNKQTDVNAFCADLAVLGFDCDKWGPRFNRPLSQEIPKAVAKLPGLKFRGMKRTDRPTEGVYAGKVFHKMRVYTRIAGTPKPSTTLATANSSAPAGPVITPDSDDCPF